MRVAKGVLVGLALLGSSVGLWGRQSEADQLTPRVVMPKAEKMTSPLASKIAPQLRALMKEARRGGDFSKMSKTQDPVVQLNGAGEVQVYIYLGDSPDAILDGSRFARAARRNCQPGSPDSPGLVAS